MHWGYVADIMLKGTLDDVFTSEDVTRLENFQEGVRILISYVKKFYCKPEKCWMEPISLMRITCHNEHV